MSVAGVVIDARGRALLIQRRDNGKWEPPGGVLEREETIPEALQREVLEETGIKIALPATLTGVYKNMTGLIVSLVFRCEATDGTPTTGDETRALRWATREEVSELADEAYAIRAHDGVKLV
ncbi:NUDIX hydrolase [Streptomyces humi]|uniref:NUDIX hydrolase n=1 Tax=Streptomyces humi TaxID=1428620 RepID=UPI0008FCC9BC|nr:NUDIX domain-containing protein [Streptomyces humi]